MPKCEQCFAPFFNKNWRKRGARFCSSKCYGVWIATHPLTKGHAAALLKAQAAYRKRLTTIGHPCIGREVNENQRVALAAGRKGFLEKQSREGSAWKGRQRPPEFCEAVSTSLKGKRLTESHRKALCVPKPNAAGEKSIRWRGAEVGYGGLHQWVYRVKGRPKACEHCGKSDGILHWANRSGEYLRDADDWITLCPKCHKDHDHGRVDIERHFEKSKVGKQYRIGERIIQMKTPSRL